MAGMNPFLAEYLIGQDYSFTIGGHRIGFMDADHDGNEVTLFHAGPLGEYYVVPVSAAQGWAITVLLLTSFLVALSYLLLRRAKGKLGAK
jgi:hypothetical protein